MIPDKIQKLIDVLSLKTETKKAIWTKGSTEAQYKISISDANALTISRWVDSYKGIRQYELIIYGEGGTAIESIEVSDNDNPIDFEMFRKLYELARRSYFKTDETIENILNAIESNDIVGKEDDDTLPF